MAAAAPVLPLVWELPKCHRYSHKKKTNKQTKKGKKRVNEALMRLGGGEEETNMLVASLLEIILDFLKNIFSH